MKSSTTSLALALTLIVVAGCSSSSQRTHETTSAPIIHRYHDAEVGFLNAFLVETESSLVAIDAGFLNYQAHALRAMVDSLGKPLRAILLTHGHVDHYGGVTILRGADEAPVMATVGTTQQIQDLDAVYEERYRPTMGDQFPENRTFPTKIVHDSEAFTWDGVRFTVHDLGPGESLGDAYWEVQFGDQRYAFIGDVVLNRVHAFFQDGHSLDWLASLNRLEQELDDDTTVYPGHGEPGSVEMLAWQQAYIEKFRAEMKDLAQGQPTLTDGAKNELVARMTAFLPGERLNFLIPWSADAMAYELANE